MTAWTELNDRQQGTLQAIYPLDQQKEAIRGSGLEIRLGRQDQLGQGGPDPGLVR
ncbi:hypothetical protein [Micromonospora andamanensis]|uniref:hypothetical protein n=1 Tax=Micromonospora andamanensis TaxID=1287068 RepID=UPI00194F17D9|nr:hypothetical protein [Micromonospora andamanensis]